MTQHTTPKPTATAALEYASRGMAVFPIKPRDKTPATAHGFMDATVDAGKIATWFGNGKDFNVGLRTGAGSGVFVVDLDGATGQASWNAELAKHGDVLTRRARSGRADGGEHWYFRHPGGTIKNRSRLLPGVDVRGDGGYVVAPPSIHSTGRAYEWINPDAPIADPPLWLCELLFGQPAREVSYSRAALTRAADAVRRAPEGARNDTLNREAYSLAGLLHTGEFTEAQLRAELTAAAQSAGLQDDEIARTINGAIERGARAERSIPARSQTAQRPTTGEAKDQREGKAGTPTDDDLVRAWMVDHPDTAYGMGEFRRYSAGVWQLVPDNLAEGEILETLIAAKSQGVRPTQGRLASVRKLAQVKCVVKDELWDADHDILVCRNGTLHIPTLTLRSHSKADYTTGGLSFDFEPGASAPAFLHALNSTQPPEVAAFIQEFSGYALTTDTRHELALWFAGPPGSGKSTIIHGIQTALGSRCGLLGLSDIERSSFGLSNLPGKTLMVSTEQPSSYMHASFRLNAIISGEPVTVDRKYREPVEIRPRAKLLWAMNDIPRIHDANDGIFRRVKVIRFGPLNSAPDMTLKDRIAAEGAGILNWALEGLMRLRDRGRFDVPANVQAATSDFKLRNDVPATFLDELCLRGDQYTIQSQALYDAYKTWCLATGHKPQSATSISDDWSRLGLARYRANGKTFWRGAGLVDHEARA